MKNGYEILWTDNALDELAKTIEYLEVKFTDREIKKLVSKIEDTTALISQNPNIYPKSDRKNVHKAVVLKHNTLYYRIVRNTIEILSFFSNRQSPTKRRI